MSKDHKVLIVEDEVLIAEDMRTCLIDLGYTVTGMAASGEQALQSIAENPPHIVLMDILLQGNTTGIEVAESIRENNGIPVIFITSMENQSSINQAKMAEPFGYLIKPIDIRDLHAAIELAIYRSELSAERHRNEEIRKSAAEFWEATFNAVPDLICLIDSDGVIVQINSAMKKKLQETNRKGIGEMACSVLYGVPEIQGTPLEKISAITENSFIDSTFNSLFNGEYLLSISPLPGRKHASGQVVHLARNITSQQEVTKELIKKNSLLEFISSNTEKLITSYDWDSIEKFMKDLLRVANGDRVFIFKNRFKNNDVISTSRVFGFRNTDVEFAADVEELQELPWIDTGFRRWFDTFKHKRIIADYVANFPVEEQGLLQSFGIFSIVAVPIFIDNLWWGFFGFCNCKDTQSWIEEEFYSLKIVANTLGATIKRQNILNELQISERGYRSLFEDSPVSLWQLDVQKVHSYLRRLRKVQTNIEAYLLTNREEITACAKRVKVISINKKTLQIFNLTSPHQLKYPGRFFTQSAWVVFTNAVAAFARGDETFEQEAEIELPDGSHKIVIVRFRVPSDEQLKNRLVVSLTDITSLKNIEHELLAERKLLETRVSERTQELTEANRKLVQEISERRLTEANLRTSQGRLDEAHALARLGHWEWNLQDNSLSWSDEIFHIFGVNKNRFKPTPKLLLEKFIHPEDRKLITTTTQKIKEEHTAEDIIYRIVRPNGDILVLYEKRAIKLDDYGFPMTIHGTVQDITLQQKKEQEIQQKVAELTALNDLAREATKTMSLERISEIICKKVMASVAPDLIAVFVNNNETLTLESIKTTQALTEFVLPEIKPDEESVFNEVVKNGKPLFLSEEQKDTHCLENTFKEYGLHSFVFLPMLSSNSLQGLILIASQEQKDFEVYKEFLITLSSHTSVIIKNAKLHAKVQEQVSILTNSIETIREGELQIRQNRELLQSVVEGITDPLILVDKKLAVRLMNHAAIDYAEKRGENGLKSWAELLTPIFNRGVRENQINAPSGLHILERNGLANPERIEKIFIYPIVGPQSERLFLVRISDITESKKMEQSLLANEKLASIGLLSAGVAHEINNPIMGVINYAQYMIDENEGDESANEIPNRILKESKRIANIVRCLLSFSRIDTDEKSSLSLETLLVDTLNLFTTEIRKNDIDLQVFNTINGEYLYGNGQQLQQVLMNLVSNAIYAVNAKSTASKFKKQIRIECLEDSGKIKIIVFDNGIGISKEILTRIYDPFFTTKPLSKGTGLGLSIVHGIIQNHGGSIHFESVENQQTTVTVILPKAKS